MKFGTTASDMRYDGSDTAIETMVSFLSGEETRQLLRGLFPTLPSTSWPSSSTSPVWGSEVQTRQDISGSSQEVLQARQDKCARTRLTGRGQSWRCRPAPSTRTSTPFSARSTTRRDSWHFIGAWRLPCLGSFPTPAHPSSPMKPSNPGLWSGKAETLYIQCFLLLLSD